MIIRCRDCGHSEIVNADLFVKIIGGAVSGFGFWAWTAFLFAGTGFAMGICIAIIAGGGAMLAYKDEIVKWLVDKGYDCSNCGGNSWIAMSAEVDNEIKQYKKEEEYLKKSLLLTEKEIQLFIKNQNELFTFEDVEKYFSELDEKDSTIEKLLKDKVEWEKLKEQESKTQKKATDAFKKRFKICYPSLSFTQKSLKAITQLEENDLLKLEQKFGEIQYNQDNVIYRDKINGTNFRELDFNQSGRVYLKKEGSIFNIICVGNKNTQVEDINYLKSYGS
jgi:hypothetical protein